MTLNHLKVFAACAALASAGLAAAQETTAKAAATAASAQPSAALSQRAADLVELINERRAPEEIFAADLLARTPPARIALVAEALREKLGRAVRVTRIDVETATRGTAIIELERGSIAVQIGLTDEAPHLITTMKASAS